MGGGKSSHHASETFVASDAELKLPEYNLCTLCRLNPEAGSFNAESYRLAGEHGPGYEPLPQRNTNVMSYD